MGTGKKGQAFYANGTHPTSPNSAVSSICGRSLGKPQLGGVIFGCKNATIKECLSKQLFGLPAQHFSYVKNIDPGLPLFLFNYSDRKLHGVFEAASKGEMFIDPYGWTADGSERTQFPAQVQIRVRIHCQPLSEDIFKQVIVDNYYANHHFWFELDHGQANKLISLLASSAIGPGAHMPPTTMQWRTVSRSLPFHETPVKSDSTDNASSCDARGDVQRWDSHLVAKEEQDDKSLIFMKLKELALKRESQDLSLSDTAKDKPNVNNINSGEKVYMEASNCLEKKEESLSPQVEHQYNIAQLMQEVKELTAFKRTQTQKSCYLEQKLVEAELEIQYLKERCKALESASNPSLDTDEKTVIQSSNELHLDLKESLFLIGGSDGDSFLAAMDLYCPSLNVLKPLRPMSSVRSYASAVEMNGELYVIGGGNGSIWYDTVESYNPVCDKWTLCPSLNKKKGCLAGAAASNKIFAIGGGNGIHCYSDIEMLDVDIGRWIHTRSMLDKRFALAAVGFNGVIYATGGFDGNDYLQSAERFDPREHCWTRIANMNTKRGCHSLVVLNEKLYALGGFDGESMVSSVEVFDPRLETWTMVEPMNSPRGYFAATVVKDSIYAIGGVKISDNISETVENYKEGQGWQETCSTNVGKRCFLSAIAL